MSNYANEQDTFSTVFTNMGWIYVDFKDYEAALESFKVAHKIALDNEELSAQARTLNNLGYGYGLNKEYQKGVNLINESIKLNPKNSFTYRNLSELYMFQDNKSESCKYLQMSLDRNIEEEWGIRYVQELLMYCDGKVRRKRKI